MYYVVAQDNAAAMLESQATRLGTFGEDTFYFLDGKAWRVTKGSLIVRVYRSDDDLESQSILRMCREANFPGNQKTMQKRNVQTAEGARDYAIEWQQWASEQNLSLDELHEWQTIFAELAERFGLEEEFQENGIL